MRKGDGILMRLAEELGKAYSTCVRRQIGCIIMNDDRMIATGVNRSPRGNKDCEYKGCIRDRQNIPSGVELENCRAVHAEMNALMDAGHKAAGGEMYINTSPCPICARMIVRAGIKRVNYKDEYSNAEGLEILEYNGVEVAKCE